MIPTPYASSCGTSSGRAGRDRCPEELGALTRPGLAAVEHDADTHSSPCQEGADSRDVGASLRAQRPIGMDFLGEGVSVLDHVEPHDWQSNSQKGA